MKKGNTALALIMALGMTMAYSVKGNCAEYNGWENSNGSWYLYKKGNVCTGWQKDGSVWYYMNSNGTTRTGWVNDGGRWYYLQANGAMATGWVNYGGTWYYLNSDGTMKTGWLQSGSTWYYLKDDGAMASGWYYLDSDGVMKEGNTENYASKKYYFDKEGVWIEDTRDSFILKTTEDRLGTASKSIDVCLINRTDHDYEVKADDNYLQRLRNDGLWELVKIKDGSQKIGNKIIRAHSSENYSIDVNTLVDGKLKPGQYKIYNYLGDKYYEYEFEVKDVEGISLKTEHRVYDSGVNHNGKVKYTITNNTDTDMAYGVDYSIEKKVDGQWEKVPLKITTFVEVAILLKAHDTNEEVFDISKIDEEKPMGEYRIVKKINGKKYYADFILEYNYGR